MTGSSGPNDIGRKTLGVYDPACLLSLSGVLAATIAMFWSTQGALELALVGLIIAGLADLFDGVLARRLTRSAFEREYGVQLDTTVDAVAFVAAPAVIALNTGATSWGLVAVVAFFVIAGVVRLAHFNTLSIRGTDQSSHHRGLPVTYMALILPLLFLPRDGMSTEGFRLLLGVCFALTGLLFIIDVPVRKPRGVFYIALPLLAAGLITYWLGRYLQQSVTT